MKGLILSGGHGTRLWPITHTQAKQLIPIANKPILFYCIEDLRDSGITDIGIIIGHTPERIKHVKDTVGDGSRWGVKITYIEQPAPSGLAHAVKMAKGFLGDERFIMYLGDNLLIGGSKKFVDSFRTSTASAKLLLTRVKDPERYGLALVDEQKKVTIKLMEKPKNPPTNLSIVGIYGFTPRIFEAIDNIKPSWRNELEITDAMQWMLENGQRIEYDMVEGWWKDTGKPEDILEANQMVLDDLKPEMKGRIEEGATVRGKVSVGENSVIRTGCNIQGPVIIGNNCTIDKGAFIGPYSSIGDGTEVLGGEMENVVILKNCRISCGKRITNSLIGANSKIAQKESCTPSTYRFVAGENSDLAI